MEIEDKKRIVKTEYNKTIKQLEEEGKTKEEIKVYQEEANTKRINKESWEQEIRDYDNVDWDKVEHPFHISNGINAKTGREEYKVDIDKVAEHIEKEYDVRTIYGLREETLELYKDGIWELTGKGTIKSAVEKLLGSYSKNNIVSEVLEKIKRRTEVSREEADNIPNFKRCLNNGVLDIEDVDNIQLVKHSKDYNFKNKFPITYNPDADCPKIKEFFKQTFYEEDIPLIEEWFGFHLVRKYLFKKLMIMNGSKDTGKTIVVNLLTSFLGCNVSGLSLQEISRGKPFDLMVLKDKDGNICDDLSSADMKAVGGIKMSVGDGYINGEMKFGDKCRFRNTAKSTYTCNKIPSSGEDIDDEAYYGRILNVSADNVVPKEEQDRNLIEKLTTSEELSGLLNLAISGYKRLIKNNDFSNAKTPEETKFLMVQNGNSLARFSSEVLIQEDGKKIDKETMYQVYCKWCMNHKPQLSPDTKEKLGRNLTKVAPYTQASSNGKERYWLNVKITDTYYTIQNNMSLDLDTSIVQYNGIKNKRYNNSESVISVINDDTNDTNSTKGALSTLSTQAKIIEDNIPALAENFNEMPDELKNEVSRILKKEGTQ